MIARMHQLLKGSVVNVTHYTQTGCTDILYVLMLHSGARERFADLPDDKRRQAAAALAMRMASLLDTDSDAENDADGSGVHL